jgi:hypothetical protein
MNRSLQGSSLRLNPQVRRHRPHDTGPITNIARSIAISEIGMSTANTPKRGLIRAVPFVNDPADVARLRKERTA